MTCRVFTMLAVVSVFLAFFSCSCVLCFASCPVDHILLNGHVADAPEKGSVKVQLVYANHGAGDRVELSLDGAEFRTDVPFLTQSRGPVLNGLGEKCKRKPETVIVMLVAGEHEYDRVSLDMAGDFKKLGSDSYVLRSEIVLHGKGAGVR